MRSQSLQREARVWFSLLRNAALLWRTGLLRFRLETFGTYFPALPYAAPSWKVSPRCVALLASQSRAYGRWLIELDAIRRHGADGWWSGQAVRPNEITHDWS